MVLFLANDQIILEHSNQAIGVCKGLQPVRILVIMVGHLYPSVSAIEQDDAVTDHGIIDDNDLVSDVV